MIPAGLADELVGEMSEIAQWDRGTAKVVAHAITHRDIIERYK